MIQPPPRLADSALSLPPLPHWIGAGRPQTSEETAFLAGAAFAHLHGVLARPEVPLALLRERLALRAAQAALQLQGRREEISALRDAMHLLGPGGQPDPGGAVALIWRQAVARPLGAVGAALPDLPERWRALAAGQGGAVAQAASVLEHILDEDPRADLPALILAEAALARALGWDRVTPLLASGLRPRDLRLRGAELQQACAASLLRQTGEAMQMAAEVTRGAGRLRMVAPKLRAAGASEAVALFLARDAVAPRDLLSLMSDRAARRFCDRLVELGAVRELTGRDSFRLYGV